MARPREVKATGKNSDGDINALAGGFGWMTASQAIRDIESGRAQYSSGGSHLEVVNGPTKKYLRTTPGGGTGNNLENLPDA